MFRRPGFSNLSFAAKVWSANHSSQALRVSKKREEIAGFEFVPDGQRYRNTFAVSSGGIDIGFNDVRRWKVPLTDLSGSVSFSGLSNMSSLHAFQWRFLSTRVRVKGRVTVASMEGLLQTKQTELGKARADLAQLQRIITELRGNLSKLERGLPSLRVTLKKLKERLDGMKTGLSKKRVSLKVMKAVWAGKDVPTTQKAFATNFASQKPDHQRKQFDKAKLGISTLTKTIHATRATIRLKESEIRLKESEIRLKESEIRLKESEIRKATTEIRPKKSWVLNTKARIRSKEASISAKKEEIRVIQKTLDEEKRVIALSPESLIDENGQPVEVTNQILQRKITDELATQVLSVADLETRLLGRQRKPKELNATFDGLKLNLEGMQAELAQLKKTLSTMLAVVSEKQVSEEEKTFAKYFGALEPSIQRSSIERKEAHIQQKEDDIRAQEKRMDLIVSEIKAKESEIATESDQIRLIREQRDTKSRAIAAAGLQSEDSLVAELQEMIKIRPRRILQLSESKKCNENFLGREAELNRAMKALKMFGDPKERRCPVLVYSSPRQGKSRLMDEVAKRGMAELGPEKLFVVVLSYNGATDTSCGHADFAVDNLAARFFCRMLLASVSVYDANSANDFEERYPLLRTMHAQQLDRILRKVHGLSDQRIWLLADEYAKCYVSALEEGLRRKVIPGSLKAQFTALCRFLDVDRPGTGNKIVLSGFTDSAGGLIIASGRRVVEIPLPLIDANQRHGFRLMHEALWSHYRDGKYSFPEMMYEVVKSCVGMMGNWIELCVKGVYPNSLKMMKVPWLVELERNKRVHLKIAERYLRKWGVGSFNMKAFLKEEANDFDSLDVGTSMMFLPLFGRTIAHPIPFYALAIELCLEAELKKRAPLVAQLRTIYEIVGKFVVKIGWMGDMTKKQAPVRSESNAAVERKESAKDDKDQQPNEELNPLRGALVESQSIGALGAKEGLKDRNSGKRAELRGLLVEVITYMILQMRCYALASLKQERNLAEWLVEWIAPPSCASAYELPPKSMEGFFLKPSHRFSYVAHTRICQGLRSNPFLIAPSVSMTQR